MPIKESFNSRRLKRDALDMLEANGFVVFMDYEYDHYVYRADAHVPRRTWMQWLSGHAALPQNMTGVGICHSKEFCVIGGDYVDEVTQLLLANIKVEGSEPLIHVSRG